MKITTTIEAEGREYRADLSCPLDISIPVHFEQPQVRAFEAGPARLAAYQAGDTRLSVSEGAGCNCPVFTFSAHLHGTHTECVGHILEQAYCLQDLTTSNELSLASLVTVQPVPGGSCQESYDPQMRPDDWVITREALESVSSEFICPALIIRTLPNEQDKTVRDYGENPPPFFTNQAMRYIRAVGVESLLVDLPSVDRLQDEGRLSNHHIYWDVEPGSHQVSEPSTRTITELIFVPNTVKDGRYLLDLNVANIRADAAPSRPLLYRMVNP